MKVLVADDNPNSRQLVKDILEAVGYEPLLAQDGPSALELANANMPDLIILDVNMPGMTGFEVCSILKSDPKMAAIPIIILTALADIDNRITGLGLGADDYLTKPFSPRDLAARVDARLRSKVEVINYHKVQEDLRATFEPYLLPATIDKLLQDPLQVKLEGQTQDVTALLIELRGIHPLIANTSAEKVVTVANAYFGLFVSLVQSYAGNIEHIASNRLLALFNMPLRQTDHAIRAIRTAVQIRDALMDFHPQFEPEFRFHASSTIYTGQVITAKLGAQQFVRFTALGDFLQTVNRMQDDTAERQILISASTYKIVQEQVKLQAKSHGCYEVLGL